MNTTSDLPATPLTPFAIANIRRFLAFRLLFGVRFYYPVFAVLFIDFGLTVGQFAVLNAVWAGAIVLCEVPSGALADALGRRALLVASGAIMVIEIALLCFVPLGDPRLVFAAFLLNRLLSGLAEALASGADEALAYDSLKACGRATDWPRVLAALMRWNSLAFVAALALGALVYDAATLQGLLRGLGWDVALDPRTTMRFPLYLTLITALGAWWAALGMTEPGGRPARAGGLLASILAASRLTLDAGRWILATPLAVAVILGGMLLDHLCRLFVTLNSTYFRLIGSAGRQFRPDRRGHRFVGRRHCPTGPGAGPTVAALQLRPAGSIVPAGSGRRRAGVAVRLGLAAGRAAPCGDAADRLSGQPLSERRHRFRSTGDGAELQGAGVQSRLRRAGLALRRIAGAVARAGRRSRQRGGDIPIFPAVAAGVWDHRLPAVRRVRGGVDARRLVDAIGGESGAANGIEFSRNGPASIDQSTGSTSSVCHSLCRTHWKPAPPSACRDCAHRPRARRLAAVLAENLWAC
ncbi:MAG: hypothetical protein V9H25_13375 [Candidatus Competibacter sp.]